MTEVWKILLTGFVTLLASGGFWSYRLKKLERKYQKEDANDNTSKKIDRLIDSTETHNNKLDALHTQIMKTNAVTMSLAKDRIYYLCNKAIKEKNTDPDNMRDIRSLLEPYTANNGDGLADEYFEKYEHMYKTSGGQ